MMGLNSLMGFLVTGAVSITGFLLMLKLLKTRKRSAKNIYKLINDLEKKYIY